MRPTLLGAAVVCLALPFAAPVHAASAAPAPGRIRSYTTDLDLGADGVLHVREVIVYDFGSAVRHGIERRVPIGRAQISGVRAGSPDASAAQPLTRSGDRLDVRIGDPSTTVTGAHTYTLDHTVRRAFRSGVLNWSAIGSEWKTPIDAATVRVKAPSGFQSLTCHTGPAGSTTPCSEADSAGPGTAVFRQRLAAGQGIAISAHLPNGAVGRDGPAWRVGVVGWIVLAVALAGVSVSGVRRDRRANRTPTAPIAEVPPAELVGLRADWGWPDLGAILAFDLAVRGHLRIVDRRPGGVALRLTGRRDPADLRPYEKEFLRTVFGDLDSALVKTVGGWNLQRSVRPLVEEAIAARGWRRYWANESGAPLPRFMAVLTGVVGFVLLVRDPAVARSVTDLSACGLGLLVTAAATWRWSRRVDPLTPDAQRLRDEVEDYFARLDQHVPTADDLPYSVARGRTADLRKYRTANETPPEWYRYDGPEKDAPQSFAGLGTMFYSDSPRTSPSTHRPRPRRTPTPARRRPGYRYGDFLGGGDDGGGHGGDGGGGSDGGGGDSG